MRVLIIGHPRCGKTTRAEVISHASGVPVFVIDSIILSIDWSGVSDLVCARLEEPGDFIIEGCSGVRGLRKYLRKGKVPDFEIMWLDKPYVVLSGKQKSFAASCTSIWKECQLMIAANEARNRK